MGSGEVSCHGLVLESVGLNQLLLIPPVLFTCVIIVQLIQALRKEEENDNGRQIIRPAMGGVGTVTDMLRLHAHMKSENKIICIERNTLVFGDQICYMQALAYNFK